MKVLLNLLLLPMLIGVAAACSSTGANTGSNTIVDVAQTSSDDAAIERYRKLLAANPADPSAREVP